MTVHLDDQQGISLLTIDRPPVNALDVETLDALSDALKASASSRAVVLTGHGGIFSAGADLVAVLQASDAEIDAGIDALTRCFRTLFLFPRPTVAAVNGPALAGGAVLTCGCDHRVIGSDASIGVVELAAGVPFPAWALELVRYAVNNDRFQDVVYLARVYKAAEALEVGLVDEISDDPLARALKVAERLAALPPSSFAITKRSMRSPTAGIADAISTETDADVKAAWRSEEVKSAIKAQLERIAKR